MLDSETFSGYIDELETLTESIIDKLKSIPSMIGGLKHWYSNSIAGHVKKY